MRRTCQRMFKEVGPITGAKIVVPPTPTSSHVYGDVQPPSSCFCCSEPSLQLRTRVQLTFRGRLLSSRTLPRLWVRWKRRQCCVLFCARGCGVKSRTVDKAIVCLYDTALWASALSTAVVWDRTGASLHESSEDADPMR